jgi:hypothetical protein
MKNAKNTKKGMLFLERRKVILGNKENYSHKHSPSAYKRWPKPYKIALLASRTLSLPRALSQPEEQLLLTITPQLVIPPPPITSSSIELIKINKADTHPHWTYSSIELTKINKADTHPHWM